MNHPNAGKCRNGATSNRCDARFSNGILSSPLPVKAWVPQGSVLDCILFRVFINNLSDFLKNPLYLFADDSTLCREIPHPSDRQAAASSLSSDLDKNHKLVKHLGLGIRLLTLKNPSHSLSLSLSERTVLQTLPSTFSTTISKKFSHSNSWISLSAMISLGQTTFQSWPQSQSLSCKVRPWHTWTPIHLWGFHAQLDGILLSPLGWLSYLTPSSSWHHGNKGFQDHCNFSWWSRVYGPITLPSPGICRRHMVHQKPPSCETAKIQNHCSPPLIYSSLFLPVEPPSILSSISFFSPGLQNSCSPPSQVIPHPKPLSFRPLLPPLTTPQPILIQFRVFPSWKFPSVSI